MKLQIMKNVPKWEADTPNLLEHERRQLAQRIGEALYDDGYLYKTEKLLSICPHCNTDLSEIALNRFYCIGCGLEIDREGKFRKMEIEFFELNGDWLTHEIKME